MVHQIFDVLRQINHQAPGAGEGVKHIRRLSEQTLPDPARCQMPELIAEIRPIVDILALRIKGCLQFDAPAVLPDLFVDRLRIQQVLFGLMQSAVEASTPIAGAPMVRLDVSTDRYTVVSGVTNSGPGVPTELQDSLLRLFFTAKRQGAGVGLASSRAIVESDDGTIEFENSAAGGSRFWFRWSVAESSLEHPW